MEKLNIIPVHQLAYYDVVNPVGEDLGQTQEFLVELPLGRIAFVVVSFGGILGLTDKWFALPWEILEWSQEEKKFILDMPREILENAPGIDKKKWPGDIDLSWLETCYAHFGCAPNLEIMNVSESQVKKLAYSIWEAEGRPDGKALEHYYRAEKLLKKQAAKKRYPTDLVLIKP